MGRIMTKQKTDNLYQKHIETIFGVKKIEEFSNEEVENAFNVLLQILPNEGKLYKYRSFEKGKFENYYDALEKGYLWFPQADNLNDDFDTVLYFEGERNYAYRILRAVKTVLAQPMKLVSLR